MDIKIHIIDKDTLGLNGGIDLIRSGMASVDGMTVSHFANGTKSTEATIPFLIEGSAENVPSIQDVDFCLTIRKKINATAIGPNGKEIKDKGSDFGRGSYKGDKPTRPLDFPPGFTELYKG